MRDLILTGVPRGGTTLTAALIDSLPDAICLSEPDHHVELMQRSHSAAEFARLVAADFAEMRKALAAGQPVLDRRDSGGKAITNYFSSADEPARRPVFEIRPRHVQHLPDGFLLAVKHNALYISALTELADVGAFAILAIVRHPADVIASWRTLDLPVSRGALPAAERFWPEMREISQVERPLVERHALIIDMLYERFRSITGRITILRYEDIVRAPNLLATVTGRSGFSSDLISNAMPPQTRLRSVERIREELRNLKLPLAHIRAFYPDI